MNFYEALNSFLLKRIDLVELNYDNIAWVFITASTIFGLIFILLHYISIRIFKVRIFKIRAQAHFLEVIVFWTIATAFVSFVGYSLNMTGNTVQSCAIIGLSWMYILTDIMNKLRKPKDVQ